MRHLPRACALFGAVALAVTATAASAAEGIPVGQLVTQTGPTSAVAKEYGQGVADAFAFINSHGGVNGKPINLQTVDYGYDPAKAIETYQKWKETLKPVAIMGWGTADTEALIERVKTDSVVFMSGSSSGHLTDPTGRSPWTDKAAPFNFFYGPSYSDGCRATVQWAAEQWKRGGGAGGSTFLGDLNRAKLAYLGDNHPFPNAPRAACIEFARELGLEVLPPIRYSLSPGDFSAQCESLKQQGASFAFLANTAESNVALVKACATAGVSTQFITNIYGWDELAAKQAGDAGNGVVWAMSVAQYGDNTPGMKLLKQISDTTDATGKVHRPAHYIRGVCSAYLMRDAMATADKAGGVTGATGANIKAAFEQMRDYVPAGLDGVCLPSTWTTSDHRGTTTVMLYRNDYNGGNPLEQKVYTAILPLRPDWLGW